MKLEAIHLTSRQAYHKIIKDGFIHIFTPYTLPKTWISAENTTGKIDKPCSLMAIWKITRATAWLFCGFRDNIRIKDNSITVSIRIAKLR